MRKILDGFGNFDEIQIPLPSGKYVGSTLRLFNPTTQLWSIYWMDSRNPVLDPPMMVVLLTAVVFSTGMILSKADRFECASSGPR